MRRYVLSSSLLISIINCTIMLCCVLRAFFAFYSPVEVLVALDMLHCILSLGFLGLCCGRCEFEIFDLHSLGLVFLRQRL